MTSVERGPERGIALPLALLLLICLGLIATAAVFLSNTDQRISSSYSRSNRSVATADAALDHGIAELTARSRAGQDPDSVQILADSMGSFAYNVWVYNKREQSSGITGVDFNGDGDMLDVVMYAQSFGYAGATASGNPGDQGFPVKLLVATATDGTSSATVQAEVAKDRLNAGLDSPFSLNSAVNSTLSGSFGVDGRLYDRNGNLVPAGTLNPPYGSTAESKAASKTDCNYYKSGIKIPSEGSITLSGSIDSFGHVSFDHGGGYDQNFDNEDPISTFKFSPEELLGVEPGYLDTFKRSAEGVSDWNNLSGVNYVTSGSMPSQLSGSGVLIVHNPNFDPRKYDCTTFPSTCITGYDADPQNQPMTLRINANGSFNGIIITDNLVKLNGDFRMLGGIVSLDTQTANIPANGTGWVRWSCEVIGDVVSQATGYDIRLAWEHRLP